MFNGIRRCVAISMLGFAGLAGTAQAASFSDLVIFGDSISDTGNVLSLTTAFAPPPFPNFSGAPGRFSDGPVWTEYLAAGLGMPDAAKPSNLLFTGSSVISIGAPGGHNFAYGGARTELGGAAGATTGLLGQLVAWDGTPSILGTGSLTRAADPGALYVVVAGANDLRDARTANPTSSGADAIARSLAATTVAHNVINAVGALANVGARHFLISNLPNLGLTPESILAHNEAASTHVTDVFNTALATFSGGLDAAFLAGTGIDLDIRMMDFHGLVNNIFDDAVNHGSSKYHITNIDTPCISPVAPAAYFFPGSTGAGCAVAAFSDDLHPSSASHALIGQLALAAAVPEASELAMFMAGLLLVAGFLRRARTIA